MPGYKLNLQTLVVLCLCFVPMAAFAQVDKGSLLGSVTDSSQAAAPRVAIRAVEMSTGVSHATVTNETGNYS